ncbi:ABC transporter ATP-binding protein [Gordonia sp. zg691]|uniref:ABC transporter ATP-binding protein n=1 Tax=Gordonia jinghuaiqii TaxID=2758710 RepID=A0A7D7LV16_9ACTN|nr:ABC transporter ATP-binding protein [Gordonia jinghuaiqii]MBD0859628.1 ABC transporter ATP-binding protein [Gordonia jinghuaiqii]MCR5976855.1 ATP-binding cassette domain-containing protein [Gordonia jinghuaiqii]QMT00518.1 ABC transporter ATP-binding protein [Gordonia jinghuaiqii]
MSMVASGLTRAFGRHTAVADASLELTSGRIAGLVGPNGAGKTTLLLLLAGLLAPDSGTIVIDDAPVEPADMRRLTGWMPDIFGTWESLTAHEILTTFAKLYGIRTAPARQRADELLELVHLTEFADRPAHELSRGQKQRLGFARALVHRPRILLLDEPASGMDPRSRMDLREQLRRLADDGCAILVSSHILSELDEMVDDVVLMTDGRTRLPAPAVGGVWRIRFVGQAPAQAQEARFDDEGAAARHLAELVSSGAAVSEFAPISTGIEDAYLALDPVRR